MKISKSLMDALVGALSEPVNIHSPRGNQVTEAWKNNYKYAQRSPGHSSGRHYTDQHGVRHDDEGYSSDGNGPADRRERAIAHKPKPAATQHFHEVPYAKKEEAKGEGMKWHAEKKKWYHTDAGKSATSKFKKLHEEVEEILEVELQEAFLELSQNHPAAWHKKQADMHPEGSLGHHLHMGRYHAKSGNSAEADKEDDKAFAIKQKIESRYGKGAHPQRAHFASKLDEEALDESKLGDKLAANAAANKDRVGIADGEAKIQTHRIGVSISDPNHAAVSQRKEQQLKFIRVKSSSRNHAISAAKEHYKKHGFNVHDAYHHSTLSEEALYEDFSEEQFEDVLGEEVFNEENGHATRKSAEGRLEALEKKHPLAKHSVIQGRRTGRWHVVRHTSGGQHIVEALSEDCGLDSKSDWKGYKTKADKKKSDGIDDDGGDKKPKDNIKEGDESESDYQAYLKSLKGDKDKKLNTIKSVRGGK